MILLGASGHAKAIIDILEKSKESIEFLVDGNPDIKSLMGYDVIHEAAFNPQSNQHLVISIGSNAIREKLAGKFAHCSFAIASHPSAILGRGVTLGEGTVVMDIVSFVRQTQESEIQCKSFLTDNGLLPEHTIPCPGKNGAECGTPMRLTVRKDSGTPSWRCNANRCKTRH